jgi:hypothetical protein
MDARTIERLKLAADLISDAIQPVHSAWEQAKNAHGWKSPEEQRLNGTSGDLFNAREAVERVLRVLEGGE